MTAWALGDEAAAAGILLRPRQQGLGEVVEDLESSGGVQASFQRVDVCGFGGLCSSESIFQLQTGCGDTYACKQIDEYVYIHIYIYVISNYSNLHRYAYIAWSLCGLHSLRLPSKQVSEFVAAVDCEDLRASLG